MKSIFAFSFAALTLMSGAAMAQGAPADAKPAMAMPMAADKPMSCGAMMDQADKMLNKVSSLQKRKATEEIHLATTAIIRNDEAGCVAHMTTALNIMK